MEKSELTLKETTCKFSIMVLTNNYLNKIKKHRLSRSLQGNSERNETTELSPVLFVQDTGDCVINVYMELKRMVKIISMEPK